jgi:hypothetical protein
LFIYYLRSIFKKGLVIYFGQVFRWTIFSSFYLWKACFLRSRWSLKCIKQIIIPQHCLNELALQLNHKALSISYILQIKCHWPVYKYTLIFMVNISPRLGSYIIRFIPFTLPLFAWFYRSTLFVINKVNFQQR